MKNRILSLMLMAALIITLAVPAALAVDNSPGTGEGDYYVYTENGKGLNVRETPGGTVVGSLKYGTKIHCYYNTDGWALIDYKYDKPGYGVGTYACFVSSRFLQKSRPAARKSQAEKAAETATAGGETSMDELNREFESAKKVTEPYKITLRPTRVTGWVNMRWAPYKGSAVVCTYSANDQLLVISELQNWLQVEDGETGYVGFISKEFVQK